MHAHMCAFVCAHMYIVFVMLYMSSAVQSCIRLGRKQYLGQYLGSESQSLKHHVLSNDKCTMLYQEPMKMHTKCGLLQSSRTRTIHVEFYCKPEVK